MNGSYVSDRDPQEARKIWEVETALNPVSHIAPLKPPWLTACGLELDDLWISGVPLYMKRNVSVCEECQRKMVEAKGSAYGVHDWFFPRHIVP